MSYDLYIKDKDGKTIRFNHQIDMKGGTYAVGGTTEAWLNMTYNYAPVLRQVFGETGLNLFNGMRAIDSYQILTTAIAVLKTDQDPDYWKCTEGNVRSALINMLRLAMEAPEGTWSVE